MPQPVLFLDDGGVMNDNQRRGQQWRRLLGEFFPPLLGGTPDAWAEANWIVANRLFEPSAWQARLRAASDYQDLDRGYLLDWFGGMCAILEIPMLDEDRALRLANEATIFVTRRVRAAYPGAIEAIRALCARGYTLHTASGGRAIELDGYLTGMGVRDCFGRLYGPNLVNTPKAGVDYYARVFADVGVDPANALVIDDSPFAIEGAVQAGARAVLVGDAPDPAGHACCRIASLAALPNIVGRL